MLMGIKECLSSGPLWSPCMDCHLVYHLKESLYRRLSETNRSTKQLSASMLPYLITIWNLTRILGNRVPTYPGEAEVMDIALINAPPGPPWTPTSGRVTEGISSSFILLWPHSEIFYFNLSIVEAERLHFNNHLVILRSRTTLRTVLETASSARTEKTSASAVSQRIHVLQFMVLN